MQGQMLQSVTNDVHHSAGLGTITKDTAACAPATGTGPTIACSLTSVTAGDMIVCNTLADAYPSPVTYTSVSDPSNGAYTIAYIDSNGVVNDTGAGMAYVLNAASGSYSVTLTTVSTSGTHTVGIQCTTWKNVLTANAFDAAISQAKQQLTNATNPTAGTGQTPTNSGELAFSTLMTGANTPTAGSSYTLLNGMAAQLAFGEYQVLTGTPSTNCPYTMSTDVWSDMCAGFIPTGGTGGITPLTGSLVTFEGTNTVAPTASTLASTTAGFWGTSSAGWTCTNTHTDLTYSTSGQLHNFLTNKWVNGTNSTGSGSTGFQFATGSNGDGCSLTFQGSYTTMSVGFWMKWDIADTDLLTNAYSMLSVTDGGGADYANIQLQPTGTTMTMRLECKSGLSSNLTVTTNTTYWVTWSRTTSSGTDNFRVYDTSGSQLISSSCAAQSGSHPANLVIVGNTGAESMTSGKHIWFDDLVIDVSGTFPILP